MKTGSQKPTVKGRGVNLEFENNRRVFEHQRLEPMVIGVRNWGQKTAVEFSFGEKNGCSW